VPAYTSFTWSKYVGDNGTNGTNGASVSEVKILYYLKSNTTAPTAPTSEITSTSTSSGVWTTAVPTYISGYTYFTCAQTKLSSNSFIWSTPVIDNALTDANSTATNAKSTADTVATMVRAYGAGVLVAKTSQTIGALVNANGSFDVCGVSWSGTTPTAGTTYASFGTTTTIGLANKSRFEISDNSIEGKYGTYSQNVFFEAGDKRAQNCIYVLMSNGV